MIISDLHLGEDLKPATKSGYLHHVPLLEEQLESFLAHYRRFRRDGRPWELVVNGDMVDFISVCLFPCEDSDPGFDPEDRIYGLGTRRGDARRKMQRVLERHPGVFRALAAFVGAGHKLGIVVGNHDVEFHWPEVQEVFKQGLAQLWSELPGARRPGALSAEQLEAAITFHPWAYFHENLVWVEHGHQYDTFCSFDSFMNPVEPNGDAVMLSLGAAAYRYMSNHVAGMDPHQQEDWGALGYLRFSLGLGWRGLSKIARGYWGFCVRLLTLWRTIAKDRVGMEKRRAGHLSRLREMATKLSLKEETLVALDDLRQRPVITNLGKLLGAVMLDRAALFLFTSLLAVVFAIVLPALWAVISVSFLLGASWTASELLSRARGGTDPDHHMRTVPQQIRDKVGARFVVFGHSHNPVAQPLAGGGMYFNTGTWVATEKPGLLRAFTHVMIRHSASGPEASLCQWRDGKSLAFNP